MLRLQAYKYKTTDLARKHRTQAWYCNYQNLILVWITKIHDHNHHRENVHNHVPRLRTRGYGSSDNDDDHQRN